MGIFKPTKGDGPIREVNSRASRPIALEKLEPRILLSGDGILNVAPNPLDTLLDSTSPVIQYAGLLDTDEQTEQQVDQELTSSDTLNSDIYEPILTLSQDYTNDESDDPELGAEIIGPTQLDSEPDLQPAGSEVGTAIVLGVNLLEDNGVQATSEDADPDCFESCQRQLIIEQLTETLRVPHGPPSAEGVPASLDDVQLEYLLSGESSEPASNTVSPLNESDLTSILDEAICRWMDTGLVSDAGVFEGVSITIADLPIGVLGQTENGVISIDVTADGHGWFVDPTPADDSEFVLSNDGYLVAIADGPAADRMDLFTVVLHELGHVVGFGHTDVLANDGLDVMRYFINTDTRLSVNASAEPLQSGFTLDLPAFAIDDPKLNEVIDNILTIYFNPILEYPDSYEFTSGQTINGSYVIPEFMNIGDTIGEGYADLELQDVILTFSNMAIVDDSWTGQVDVKAEIATLFPGLLDIEVDDSDDYAVEGTIYLAEGNSESELYLDDIDVVKIGWPGFLEVVITDLKLEFDNFRMDDNQNSLHLTVDLAGFNVEAVVVELEINGSATVDLDIEEIENTALAIVNGDFLEAMKAAVATVMASKLTELKGEINGSIFKVGSLSAGFIYKSVTHDPDGEGPLPERSVVYLAVTGSLSIGEALAGDDDGGSGFGGFGFAFAISELGPLHFYAYVDIPITLEPVSGLAISSMGLGVIFNQTIEGMQDEIDFEIDEVAEVEDVGGYYQVTLRIDEDHDLVVGDDFRIVDPDDDGNIIIGDFKVLSVNGGQVTYLTNTFPVIPDDAAIIRLTIKDPLDLEDSGLESGLWPGSLSEWESDLTHQVEDQMEKGGNFWARLLDEVVLGGQASLSFDPRIPDMLMSFDVRFLLGIGLGINEDPILQIFLNGEMSLLGGMVSFSNTRLYADLSDLFSGEGKFLYLQTQGELDVPVIGGFEPLLVYRGEVSFETFLVGDDVLDALVTDTTASGYWTVVLTLADTSGYSADDSDNENEIAIFDSNPLTFGGTYEVIEIDDIANTITYRIYCDLDGENGCSEEEIAATNPGTWVSGSSSAKVAKKNDLGGGFRISLGGGIDLNIPGVDASGPITVTTLTLETIEDDITVSFIVPPDSAEEEFRIELSFAIELSETHVGNIAEAAGLFVVALDVEDDPGAPVDEFIVIYGAAELTTDLEFLENIGLYMNLEAFLRINSSNQDGSIELPGGLEVDLPAYSFLIRFEGKVDFRIDFNLNGTFAESESVFEIEGIFVLEFSPGGFNAAVFRINETTGLREAAVLRLGPQNFCFIEFNVFAFLAIRNDGFAAHLAMSAEAALPLDLASINAAAVFIVNTTGGNVEFEIPGGADPNRPDGLPLMTIPGAAPANPSGIIAKPDDEGSGLSLKDLIDGDTSWDKQSEPGAYGVVFLDGSLNLLSLLGLEVSGYILLSKQVMSLELNFCAGLNFLKLVSAETSGTVFFSSEGEFVVEVFAGVQLGPDWLNIHGSAELLISYLDDNGKASGGNAEELELEISGSLSVGLTVDIWPFPAINLDVDLLTVDYDPDSGEITVSIPYPEPFWDSWWGIPYPNIRTAYYNLYIGTFKIDPPPPPVLGQVVDGVLTLNVGPYAGLRNLLVDEVNEDVEINQIGTNTIRITMFGVTQVFENVNSILIDNMDTGDDTVRIGTSVTIPVTINHFGEGMDRLSNLGSGVVIAYGDEGNDRLDGGSANDQLFGGPGDDFIDGKAGQDWIEGNDDIDTLIGGIGSDTIIGGTGGDLIAGDLVCVTSNETDSVFETIGSASGGNDILDGGDDADVILGGSGNDQINGGAGEDVLIGDDGIVTFSQELGMTYELTDLDYSGNDIIDGGADNDDIYGGAGSDSIHGDSGNDLIYGNEDDDEIHGGSGEDDIYGGTGDDTIYGDQDNDVVNGNDDNDTIYGGTGDDIINGNAGDDYIQGNEGQDTINGGTGDDEIYGGTGSDTIYGDSGNDLIYGNEDDDEIHGGSGEDHIYGDTGDDTIYGDGDNDVIEGNDGNDIIMGNAGIDTIYGHAGNDILIGDNGVLDFAYNGDTDLTTLDLICSATDGYGGGDIIYGNAGSDVILGGTGGDEIQGGDDPDILIGDNADIFLSGFVSGSLMILDSAVNKIISTDTEESTGGADTIRGNEASDIIIGGVNGSSDILSGNDGDDLILGDNGLLDFAYNGDTDLTTLDLICSFTDGLGGGDIIYGNGGDDVLIGGTGGDRIDGNEGKDLILGDNGVLTYMNGDTSNPRFRVLEGTVIYGETTGVNDGLPLIDRDYQFNDPAGIPQWAGWEVTLSVNSGGADYIAGGPDNDQIFGQGGNDIIQGDGNIDPLTDVNAYRDAEGLLVVSASVEHPNDGDDYIEGNEGNDVIFGNLGQDDIIGGSSGLFGLDTAEERADGQDMIFGGAGTDISRNDEGDVHGRDSDMILGDNGNIFRIVNTDGFNYDNSYDEAIVVRAAELLDYTPGGLDYDADSAANDKGAPDEIHGESGDDFLYGMKGNDIIFGEGQDDDIIGGYGHDWISGGTGDDGVLGDDGRIYTSRNGTAEPLYGIDDLAGELDKDIRTPDKKQQATINVNGQLKKTVNLTPFKLGDPEVPQYLDEFDPLYADDIIFGGWGNDSLHGGDGDDAISGAEALTQYYDKPANLGDVLKFGDYREGEFGAYNRDDPLSKVYWNPETGEFGGTEEFLLNFDHTEGDPVNDDVNTDGDDVIFGDLGNDWLVGGTGRDHLYGGRGCDLLNADDNLDTAGGTNSEPDGSESSYEDLAYGGAGSDVLIANISSDRLIDWVGDFNTYVSPYTSFGADAISRNLKPRLFEFLYDLSRSDGADQTLGDSDDPRNGEPNGELGLVSQKDPDWEDQQTPDDEG